MRFPNELLARVDAHLERMRGSVPGVTFNRSDAMRSLVTLGLEVAEKNANPSRGVTR